jgi:hypothetical protein
MLYLKGGRLSCQSWQRPLPPGMQSSRDIWELLLKAVDRLNGLLSTTGLARSLTMK